MTANVTDPRQLHGMTVTGRDGEKLGKVDGVYLDRSTERPTWAAIKSGLFGTHVSLVPLTGAEQAGDHLRVPFDKDALKSAPHQDPDKELSPREERELFEHYGIGYGDEDARNGHRHRPGHSSGDAMTRSEERMRVGKERTEAGKARLRKYVVTENVTHTVPVSHEEVRLEREPITEHNRDRAMSGPAISEDEHEVTLHAERPVTQTEAVPVERVRLGTETVTQHEQVHGKVRKERIETDGVDSADRHSDRPRRER